MYQCMIKFSTSPFISIGNIHFFFSINIPIAVRKVCRVEQAGKIPIMNNAFHVRTF